MSSLSEIITLSFFPLLILGWLSFEYLSIPQGPPTLKSIVSYIDIDQEAIKLTHTTLTSTLSQIEQDIISANNSKVQLQLSIDSLNNQIRIVTTSG